MVQSEERNILPSNIPPQPPAVPSQALKEPEATTTSATSAQQPLTRHTYQRPIEDTPQQHQQASTPATSIPHPKDVQPTSAYWVREGNMWKTVHIQPRRDLYIPQQTDDGPDVTRLTQQRRSIIRPMDGTRVHSEEDDWTTKRQATFDKEWTGSTNFEEPPQFKDEFITEDIDEQQEARKAKGIPAPRQPTEQERMEHELTHLPYRS